VFFKGQPSLFDEKRRFSKNILTEKKEVDFSASSSGESLGYVLTFLWAVFRIQCWKKS